MLFFGSEVRFANRLYVGGNAAPTAKLHLSSSGSSAAGTAAFKLTGGTLLASPEAGVIEPNLSGRLFYSPSNNNRRAFVYTDVATPSLGTVPVGNGVDYEIKNGITEVSTTVGVNLSAPGQTTLHIVPASGLNGLIITDVILETTSVAGGASQPPVVAVGTGIAYDSIVEAQATLLVSNSSYSMLRVRLNATIAAPGDGLSIDVMTPSDVIMEATVRLFGYYI